MARKQCGAGLFSIARQNNLAAPMLKSGFFNIAEI